MRPARRIRRPRAHCIALRAMRALDANRFAPALQVLLHFFSFRWPAAALIHAATRPQHSPFCKSAIKMQVNKIAVVVYRRKKAPGMSRGPDRLWKSANKTFDVILFTCLYPSFYCPLLYHFRRYWASSDLYLGLSCVPRCRNSSRNFSVP